MSYKKAHSSLRIIGYNDAFLGLIRKDHMDFIDWVVLND